MRAWPSILLAAALLAGGAGAQARLAEEQIDVPVQVRDAQGSPVSHTVRVTVFSDDANPRPAPLAIINHGRSGSAEGRAALGRARYGEAARYLVGQGFVVAVPTRVGYGVTGGADVEASGACARRDYPPAYAAAADQTLAVLAALRRRPDVAPERVLVMGQSFGGLAAVAVAAANPPGVRAAINFAGGGGGSPSSHPGQPCSPTALEALFQGYGRTARVPMLWVYAENDRYFGPHLPRQWHAAFTQAGGQAQFVQFPPHGQDGHALFTRFPAVWQPVVSAFLDTHGFTAPHLKQEETQP